MSQPTSKSPATASPAKPTEIKAVVPSWVDYLFILLGVALSLLFTEWAGLETRRQSDSPEWMTAALAKIIPYLLLLPSGIILWWPLFFATGRMRGRLAELTWAEWLWGVVWLLDLALVGSIAWYHFQGLPSFLTRQDVNETIGPILRIGVFVIAGGAAVIAIVTLIKRTPVPWTHHFGLALLLWPLVPLLLLWLGNLVVRMN